MTSEVEVSTLYKCDTTCRVLKEELFKITIKNASIICVELEDIIGRVILRKSPSIAFSIYFDKLKLILKLTSDRAKLSLKFRYCKKATRFEKKSPTYFEITPQSK